MSQSKLPRKDVILRQLSQLEEIQTRGGSPKDVDLPDKATDNMSSNAKDRLPDHVEPAPVITPLYGVVVP